MSTAIKQAYYKVLRFGLLAVLFVPLIYWRDTFSPFEFTKGLVFRVAVEALFVVWLALALVDKKYRPQVNLIFWLVNAWFLSYLITSLLGVDWSRSFWGTLERMGGFVTQLHLWLYFVMLVAIFKTKEDWELFFKISVVASFLNSLYALGQKADLGGFILGSGVARVFGTIGNAALFAGYTLFNFFWALYFLLQSKLSPAWRKFMAVAVVLQLVTILMTAVRGSIIALLAGLVVVGLFYVFSGENRKTKKGALGAVALVVVISLSVWLARDTELVQNNSFLKRVTDISLQTKTIQTRFWTWQIAWEAFSERPVFGWGPENFSVGFARHFNPLFFESFGSETFWDRAHNLFLDILASMGIFGFTVYAAMMVAALYVLWKIFKAKGEWKMLSIFVFVILLVYHIHTFFIFDNLPTYLMLFSLLGMLAWVYSQTRPAEEEIRNPNRKEEDQKPKTWLIYCGLFLVFLLSFPLLFGPLSANHTGTRALVASWAKKHQETIADYHAALDSESFSSYEVRHRLASYAFDVAREQKQSKEEIQNTLAFAISEARKNIAEHPLDYLPYLYLGRLLNYQAIYEPKAALEAETALDKAVELNPYYPRIYYEIGQVQIIRDEYQNALATYKKALELNPKVGVSYWYMAVTYSYLKDYKSAIDYVRLAQDHGYVFTIAAEAKQVAGFYAELKDYPNVIAWYKTTLELDGSNAQVWASLAAAYKEAGQYNQAKEAAQKAATLDPANYGAEARSFIESLK